MRLIDADAMLERNKRGIYDTTDLKEMLNYEPTAYDVDRVMEQLEEMSGVQFDGQNESYQLDWCICTSKAVDIIKRGGKEE